MIVLITALNLHGTAAIGQGAPREYRQLHMGMEVRLLLHADSSIGDAAARATYARIADLEQILSDWRPTSELRQLSEHPGTALPVSAALAEVTSRALAMARISDGAFDPTVGPLVALWRAARERGTLPTDSAITVAKSRVDWRRIELNRTNRTIRLPAGVQLDLGGIAKGWILSEAGTLLREHGITAFLIEAGGDLFLGEAPPDEPGWRVAVQTEHGDTTLVLDNIAVATSGPSAQSVVIGGVRYSHVIDPRTGHPLTSAMEVSVLHRDPATADALATAITVLGPAGGAWLAAQYGAALIVRAR